MRRLRDLSDARWAELTKNVPRVELTKEQAELAVESERRVLSGVELPTTAEFRARARATVRPLEWDCCEKCSSDASCPFYERRMIVCPTCGNKRCPRASNHALACTGSNEPGQDGSVY